MSVGKVYVLDISFLDNEERFSSLFNDIKEYRKDKISSLSFKDDKLRSLGAEILLKKACEDFNVDYKNTLISFNEFNKPFLKGSKYFYNISHSKDKVVLIFSDTEVGIDIEYIKPNELKVANRFFTINENNLIKESKDPLVSFYKIWTLKESYIKCIGEGLKIPLNSFDIILDEYPYIKDNKGYTLFEYCIDGYSLSTCVKAKDIEKFDIESINLNK